MEVIVPNTGLYVLAVSGGVDSVALLDVLSRLPQLKLIVTHFDHGIREDSHEDRLLVQKLAADYGLPFEYTEGRLGAGASEAAARAARYRFLRDVQKKHEATAIITAHHQDDVLETAVINLLRGTGRRGLTALADRPDLRRPLVNVPKGDILQYAGEHGLRWREDSTNADETYLRNYVRRRLIPKLSVAEKQRFLTILNTLSITNKELDEMLSGLLRAWAADGRLQREWFNGLPHATARELMAAWLRNGGVTDFNKRTLERLVVAAKTARPGACIDILHGVKLRVCKEFLALEPSERWENPASRRIIRNYGQKIPER